MPRKQNQLWQRHPSVPSHAMSGDQRTLAVQRQHDVHWQWTRTPDLEGLLVHSALRAARAIGEPTTFLPVGAQNRNMHEKIAVVVYAQHALREDPVPAHCRKATAFAARSLSPSASTRWTDARSHQPFSLWKNVSESGRNAEPRAVVLGRCSTSRPRHVLAGVLPGERPREECVRAPQTFVVFSCPPGRGACVASSLCYVVLAFSTQVVDSFSRECPLSADYHPKVHWL